MSTKNRFYASISNGLGGEAITRILDKKGYNFTTL